MKKTLIATALAVGFAGAASAQSSVTLYGILDGGFGYTQYKDKSAVNALIPGADEKATRTGPHNRWGLQGVESLGDGLRVRFRLENGFDLFRGVSGQGGRLFGRSAWLALEGDSWGTLRFGRDYTPSYNYNVEVVGVTADGFGAGNVADSFSMLNLTRADNLVTYETPSFAGFQAAVAYSFQYDGAQPWDIKGATDTDRPYVSTALRYTSGPLAVSAAYDVLGKDKTNPNGWIGGEKDLKAWMLAASYDFGVVKLHAGFGQEKNGSIGGRDTGHANLTGGIYTDSGGLGLGDGGVYTPGYKTTSYAFGVGVPLGDTSRIRFGWHNVRLNSGVYKDFVNLIDGKRSQNRYNVVYTYGLSKRTVVYASGAYGTGTGFNNITVTQAAVGLRHAF